MLLPGAVALSRTQDVQYLLRVRTHHHTCDTPSPPEVQGGCPSALPYHMFERYGSLSSLWSPGAAPPKVSITSDRGEAQSKRSPNSPRQSPREAEKTVLARAPNQSARLRMSPVSPNRGERTPRASLRRDNRATSPTAAQHHPAFLPPNHAGGIRHPQRVLPEVLPPPAPLESASRDSESRSAVPTPPTLLPHGWHTRLARVAPTIAPHRPLQ